MHRFILILVIISLLMDWYVYQGIKRITANLTRRKQLAIRWGYWVFFIGLIVAFSVAIYLRFEQEKATPAVQFFINAFLTFFVTKLVFILVLLAEDIYRILKVFINLFRRTSGEEKVQHEPLLPERRKFVSLLAVVLAGVPFASFVYGVTKGKYAFKVHRQVLYFEDLPSAFDGFTITQLSDVHSGSLDDAEAVKRGVELAQAQQSDLFVFTGDLVNNLASEIEPFMDCFSQLRAPFGQYSILGNHDYGMYHDWPSEAAREENMEQLKRYHAAMGYRLLLDEHVLLEKDGDKLALLGVENWGRGFIVKGNLEKALSGVDEQAFKVLLSHDPSHWTEIVKEYPNKVHLTLSGHTHGMQFGVETPLFRWSPVQYRYEHWAGLAQDNNRQLYVNRGFGFIGFAGRVGIWPEITVLELRKGKA